MKVLVRADASVSLGSGHVMRCLTLAEALAERGASVAFVSREYPGNLCSLVSGKGFPVFALPPIDTRAHWAEDADATSAAVAAHGADWLIVDNYALDRHWESKLRCRVGKILVIDDLADRPHDCDILLDQNLVPDGEFRYRGLLPSHCRTLIGPRFALLRREYLEARRSLRRRDGTVGRILISFGGSDPTGETEKALTALRQLSRPDLRVDVVLGAGHPDPDRIGKLGTEVAGCTCHRQISTMARLMAQADLALGSGGATTWERCYLGLPALIVVVAANQSPSVEAVSAAGAACSLGCSDDVSVETWRRALGAALADPAGLRTMGARALAVMGGEAGDPKSTLLNLMTGGPDA